MRPDIIILDGHTLNGGDLTWQPFEALGQVTVYDRSDDEDTVVTRTKGATCAIINKTEMPASTLAQLPDLRYVGVTATGTNVIDSAAARKQGVTVTNVPGYGAESVAQHVFALLLEMTNRVGDHDRAVREGQWAACPDFCFTLGTLTELAGKTLGIVGVGAIGRRVAMIGHALGMRIAAAHQRSMNDVKLPGIDIAWMTVDDLFALSDVITLHCPLTPQTKRMVNAERIGRMKRSAYLINTGRGGLVDEAALADALRSSRIAGAGLDVLSVEPPVGGQNPLLSAPNGVITPHIAWATIEARQRCMRIAAENLQAFLSGKPINVVN